MTDREQDLLISLGVLSADLASVAQELLRLRDLTEYESVKAYLDMMAAGFLNIPNVEFTPFMKPAELVNPDVIFRGGNGVGDLHAMFDGDAYSTLWKTDNITHRLAFLRHGCINLVFHGNRIPPMSIRNDIDERFGFENNQDK